jgi:hypothetical protein
MRENCHVGKSIYETIPEEIKSEIDKFTSYPVKYSVQIPKKGGFKCDIYICFPETQSEEVYARMMEKMVCWLHLAIEYAGIHCAEKSLTVHLFMSNHEKRAEFDGDFFVLDRINVNSGQSSGCKERSEICIYRKEEWLKVFMHETCHSLGLSFNENMEEYVNLSVKQILKGVDDSQNIHLFETHCEVVATLFNCVFSVLWNDTENKYTRRMESQTRHQIIHQTIHQKNKYGSVIQGGVQHGTKNTQKKRKHKRSIRWLGFPVYYRKTAKRSMGRGGAGGNDWKTRMVECMNMETLFSLYQCEKIMKKYCHGNVRCFYDPGLDWKENTNVLSYYFAKTVVLCNIDNYVTLLEEKNGEHGGFSLWNWNEADYNDYIQFVFITSFSGFQNKYDEEKENKNGKQTWKKSSIMKKTMRMTIVGNNV